MNDNDTVKNEHDLLSQLLDRQINLESKSSDELSRNSDDKIEECAPPKICHEFQTARLFLSHFGFLNLDNNDNETSNTSGLTALDPTMPGFCTDLENLDHTSPRTCDTVHVFYVRAGQKSVEEILSNVVNIVVQMNISIFLHLNILFQLHESSVSPHFLEFLSSLGWPVSVSCHAGWTGHVSTSWRATVPVNVPQPAHSDHGGALYNGDTHILYWADVSSEVAFIVPTHSVGNISSDSMDESNYNSDISSGQGSL